MQAARSFKLSVFKKIKFNLIGGNFNLFTHPLNQIDIKPALNSDSELTPYIEDKHSHIEISGQQSKSFLPQRAKVSVDVFLPEKSDVEIDVMAGSFNISGMYSDLKAKLKFGEVIWNVQTDHLNEGRVKMWAGSTIIIPRPEDKVVLHVDSFRKKLFSINDVDFKCEMIVGDIQIGAPVKRKAKEF